MTQMITNDTAMPTGPLGVRLQGPQPDQFRIQTSTCGGSLAPAASCSVSVIFHPTSEGDKTADLVVAASWDTALILLGGAGNCSAAGLITPTTVDFSSVSVSAPPAMPPERAVTLGNRTCGPVGPITVNLSGTDAAHFAIVQNDCEAKTLQRGADCTVTVSFKPTTVGAKTAFVDFYPGSNPGLATQLKGTGN